LVWFSKPKRDFFPIQGRRARGGEGALALNCCMPHGHDQTNGIQVFPTCGAASRPTQIKIGIILLWCRKGGGKRKIDKVLPGSVGEKRKIDKVLPGSVVALRRAAATLPFDRKLRL